MKRTLYILAALMLAGCSEYVETVSDPVDYVSTLTGTLSHHAFSTGNTYPAVALPWGMNFWTPQGGRMGDGWAYRYDQNWIRGFKQTHQPSPWINDYGQFAIMPVRDAADVDENARASYFSHKSETAKPYYYQVYLADHDINVELSPTERAAVFEFTFPESETSGVVVDAFDQGSYIKVLPERNAIVGYTTKNSGGVPDNFKNWFVLQFDKPFESWRLYDGPAAPAEGFSELEGDRVLASVSFKTSRGEKVSV
jgi:predicted alpha-1,2-mannosidase